MDKLQPIALIVENEDTYKVRFQTDNGEVEYKFTMELDPVPFLVSDNEFLKITNGDPAAARLKQAICNFHQARHFEYTAEESGNTAQIKAPLNTDATRRVSEL